MGTKTPSLTSTWRGLWVGIGIGFAIGMWIADAEATSQWRVWVFLFMVCGGTLFLAVLPDLCRAIAEGLRKSREASKRSRDTLRNAIADKDCRTSGSR